MRFRELAGITTPEPRVLVIQPWDATTVHPIEKAILKANLGLNPSVDRKVIRIVLRDLSQERRQEFVKIARKMAEDGRVAVRHVRRDLSPAAFAKTQSPSPAPVGLRPPSTGDGLFAANQPPSTSA